MKCPECGKEISLKNKFGFGNVTKYNYLCVGIGLIQSKYGIFKVSRLHG